MREILRTLHEAYDYPVAGGPCFVCGNQHGVVCLRNCRDEGRLGPRCFFGTHFFSELIEMDMLYLALCPGREGNTLNTDFFENTRNRLTDLLPSAARWGDVVRVIDTNGLVNNPLVRLNANTLKQEAVCYFE